MIFIEIIVTQIPKIGKELVLIQEKISKIISELDEIDAILEEIDK